MSWERILQIDALGDGPLRSRIDALFAQQRATWPALAEGEAQLRQLRARTLRCGDDWIVVQANPARRRSTHAKTDVQSIAARACFLCPQNMPPEERGIAFANFVILPNPFPIVPIHCTIAERKHRPQQLAGSIGPLLQLAAEVGPDLAVVYNGPRCGASAPDHLHFQAAAASAIPILEQLPTIHPGHRCTAHCSFGRTMLIFAKPDIVALQSDIGRSIELLGGTRPGEVEPMFNLLVHFDGERLVAVLYPRVAHRSSHYSAPAPGRLAVSPAVLEMSGLLVTSEPEDVERIDAGTARAIFEEVSVAPAEVERLADALNAERSSG
jgi:hypothetical protein